MFNVKWDPEINGILLTDEEGIVPPRPVFFEELDLLGFNKYWDYPKSDNPLLWATGRKYYYKGEHVATAKKGDALNLPKLVFEDGFDKLTLDEIDIETVIKRNEDALFVLENEAIDFIEDVCKKFPDFPLSISFSGGKDSQSVLDLITRVVHSDDINIIFSDTTLEHEYTYRTVEKTIKQYKQKCPDIQFNIAKPVKSAKELFEDMGLPSRFHRWCTPVLKTAPYNKLINELIEPNSKIIVFEGVRAEESPQRSKYKRVADGVKHPSIINARPILYWNFSEVMLYNFYRKLLMNPLYRFGLSRVGCELCPYASQWSECINSHIDNKFNEEYVPLIKNYAKNRGVSSESDLNKFVSEGQWKKRAGGKAIDTNSAVNFSQSLKSFKAVLLNPNENFLEWIKILGKISYYESKNIIRGELNYEGKTIPFTLTKNKDKQIVEFFNIQNNAHLQSKIKKVLQKSTFCVHCGVCDIECLKGAINTFPLVQINSRLCDNCDQCIKFTQHGCYRAKSVNVGSGGKTMKNRTGGIDRYSTFGLREQWLEEFLEFGDDWLSNNNLGPKQIPAVKVWLSEAGLLDNETKKATNLANDLKVIYKNDPLFVWGVIWVNLYYNSNIINWYCDNFDWGIKISREELLERLMESYDLAKNTLKNPIGAMINMFDNSPLGDDYKFGILEKKGRAVKFINKFGVDGELNSLLVAYALYKVAENKMRFDFIVSELYDENFQGGPYKLFGISQTQLERVLRGLQQLGLDILNVELAADLENIFLNNEISSEQIVKFKKEGV